MNTHNRINYIELGAPNLETIQKFYSDVFGWTFTDYGPDYVAFSDGNLDGGFERGSARTGGPLVIMYSDDLEATLARIIEAGGIVTKPIFTFPGGRRFHFTDLAGNELAVWSE